MKAIELLKYWRDTNTNFNNSRPTMDINEAINELECIEEQILSLKHYIIELEQSQNETCFTCKHKYEENIICDICVHNVGFMNYWEDKDES